MVLRLQLDNKEFISIGVQLIHVKSILNFYLNMVFGTILVFYIIFKLVLSRIFEVFNDTNYIQIGSMIFILTTLTFIA